MFRNISSFNHVEDDLSSPKSTKKTKQSSKNPYSSRGLDKFTSVLSDLEARKEKIMAKKGLNAQSGTMVRFMYSNSQDWIPIVVRLKEENTNINNNNINNNNSNPASPKKVAQTNVKEHKEVLQQEKKVKKKVTWIEGEEGKKRVEWWKLRPSYYMLMAMLLILVSLVVFGRVFAICCTAVWWYMVPSFSGGDESGSARRRSPSKDCARKVSDKSARVGVS